MFAVHHTFGTPKVNKDVNLVCTVIGYFNTHLININNILLRLCKSILISFPTIFGNVYK